MLEPQTVYARRPGRLLGRDFVLLWQGQLASSLGNQAFLVAAMSWLLEATSSPGLMGLWLMTSSLPAVLFGPLAGALVDRHSRRTLIVISDLVRGLGHVALAAVLATSPDATSTLLALFLALGCLSGALGALVSPALAAAIPDVVSPRQLGAANSLHHLSSQAATLVGQAAGGIAYVWIGASGLILFDGVTFLASAACAGCARLPSSRAPQHTAGAPLRLYAEDVRAGVTWLWARRPLRSVTLTFAAVNFLFMPVFVLLPIYVRDVLRLGPQWYGFLLAAAGGGAMLGAVLALQIRAGLETLGWALLGIGACTLALGFNRSSSVALSLLFVGGLFSAILNVAVITTLQASTPAELRGRILAVATSLAGAAVPAGLGLGGFMGGFARTASADVISCSGAGILGIAGFYAIRRRARAAELELDL